MAIMSGDYLNKTELKCQECKGSCFDADSSTRQANVRSKLGLPIPNACVGSVTREHKCPFNH